MPLRRGGNLRVRMWFGLVLVLTGYVSAVVYGNSTCPVLCVAPPKLAGCDFFFCLFSDAFFLSLVRARKKKKRVCSGRPVVSRIVQSLRVPLFPCRRRRGTPISSFPSPSQPPPLAVVYFGQATTKQTNIKTGCNDARPFHWRGAVYPRLRTRARSGENSTRKDK